MLKKTFPFWLITISFFLVLCVSQLIQDGMFMDGMIYTCVGKNLANGLGTFWHPTFSKTLMSIYHEQPPLMFGLEAVFFKLFGTSMYVERFYSLLAGLLNALLISKIWKLWFSDQQEIKNNSWFPLFLWILIPVTFWAITNNVEENTMSLFVLTSMFFILKALKNNPNNVLNLFIAGCFIVAATMCKGIQGAFPIVSIVFFWFFFRTISFKQALKYSVILGLPFLIFYTIVFMNPVSLSSFQMYFHDRIVNTFVNKAMATTETRFNIVFILLNELLPVYAVVVLLFVIAYKNKISFSVLKLNHKATLFFLFIGLAGSLPLMITLEQRSFYLVTPLPYFVLAIGIYIAPLFEKVIEKINTESRSFKVFKIITIPITIASFIFVITCIGKTKRNNDELHDVYTIGKVVPEGSVMSSSGEIYSEWSLQAYFNRYYYISIDQYNQNNKYLLVDKTDSTSNIPSNYKKMNLNTLKYDVYKN